MRVLIDTTYAESAPHSGTGVYVRQLIAALAERPEVEVVTAVNPRRRPPAGGGLGSLRNALADLWWLELGLPRRAATEGADLIHHPLPARSHATQLPQVVTVHDLAFERLPGAFDRRFRAYAHLAHRDAARHAAAVIAVSETTASDVRELWDVPARRIVVARHGPGQVGPPPAHDPAGEAPASPPGYYLYVGDDEPRKDLTTLLVAYSRYRAAHAGQARTLVLAGSAHPTAIGVRHERDPSPERVRQLLAGAAALVHPARYEGFGLTAVEALALGTPVIAARTPALVEVCGEAAGYFEPGDAGALARLLDDPPAPDADRAALFSWASSAERHLAAYSLVRQR